MFCLCPTIRPRPTAGTSRSFELKKKIETLSPLPVLLPTCHNPPAGGHHCNCLSVIGRRKRPPPYSRSASAAQESPSSALEQGGLLEEGKDKKPMADVPIPNSVMESVHRTQTNLEEFRTNMTQFLGTCDVDVLAELSPLQCANTFLTLAKAISTLVSLNLRCNGMNPEDHPVKSELERVSLYEDKLEKLVEYNKGPSRPSTTINYQAATRVIGHSLPDLMPDQKQSLREIGSADGHKSRTDENRRARKKRKYHSSEKQSIKVAAQEFLEKAKRELLGEEHSFKGPFHGTSSDEEEGKEN